VQLLANIGRVLRRLEFIAAAVLSEAADEYFIRDTMDDTFKRTVGFLGEMIIVLRRISNDDKAFINVTKLAEKWQSIPKPARKRW
jgi:hypothetical protein